ncbi:NUDIX hydrolase [Gordonia zhaorongruii]|uniref:NUDIX hydrolase n=1 Tax=Gordonia zhaorongruii TaxID=2597659 RepID=UPI0010437D89|nr:NUDIX domain-containing protein [Gordonia zhaorongruii]
MPKSMCVEVLTAVFQARECAEAGSGLSVLLTHDPRSPADPWALPGGQVGDRDTLEAAAQRHLGEQAELTRIAHLEQLSFFSEPDRVPGRRAVASTFLGLVPRDIPAEPTTGHAAWHDVASLPPLAFDHEDVVTMARQRLAAKLSYTNIAFALAPGQFSMSELSDIYGAGLGYPVDSTNLLRILSRRGVVVSTGTVGRTGRAGGRPPSLYAFADTRLRVTDEFATLRPPM